MMKKIVLIIFSVFISMNLLSQNVYSPIEPKWEVDYQGNQENNYYNNDFCDYYLVFSNRNYYELRPGKNTVMRLTKGTSNSVKNNFPSTYQFYKGKFITEFNNEFIYSLPIKNGDSTRYKVNSKERNLTFRFKIKSEDTIYATRSGIVCLDDAIDMSSKYNKPKSGNSVLIYHNDNTFAEYKNFSEIFVNKGDIISVGQAIGKGKKGLEEGTYSLTLAFFFLDKNKVTNNETGSKYSHFSPKFHTANAGNLKLEESTLYISQLTDSIITQEMSKREIKKYEKKKLKAQNKK